MKAPVTCPWIDSATLTDLMRMVIRLREGVPGPDETAWDPGPFIVHICVTTGASVIFQVRIGSSGVAVVIFQVPIGSRTAAVASVRHIAAA